MAAVDYVPDAWRNELIHGDSIQGMSRIPDSSVHLILSDIPYGLGAEAWDVLHKNRNSAFRGSSPAQERAGAVFQRRGKPINGWSEADRLIPKQYQEWCEAWASEWLRVLVPGGAALVFAGRRLGHRCVAALEDSGFSYKDGLAWLRPRAPHRAQRLSAVYGRRGDDANAARWIGWRVGNLRPVYEPIHWFTKPYKIGTTIADNVLQYGVGAYHESGFLDYVERPDNVLSIGFESGETGLHPTQKPVKLMEALIELASLPGQTVLDPFAGSGATLVAAKSLGRDYAGFELDYDYYRVAADRISAAVPVSEPTDD